MIVHGLRAENLLKYKSLRLDDLPERGVIAISGLNESGKSTLGETLCFALFGRTFAVSGDEPGKLIRWGESRCTVDLVFSEKGQRYRISRMLDRDGNHSARLSRDDDADNPLARGVDTVAELLLEQMGYAFEEFIESFYLAQREITTPHPHSFSVKVMAGVAPMEHCRGEFREEIENERGAASLAGEKVAEVDGQIGELGFDPARLRDLETQRADLQRQLGWFGERRDALVEAGMGYRERGPKLHAAERGRGMAALLSGALFVAAALVLGLWALLTRMPESGVSRQIGGLLNGLVPDPGWLLYAAVALAVLLVLGLFRVVSLRGRIVELRGAGGRLANELGILDELESALPANLSAASREEGDDGGAVRADPEIRDHRRRRIESSAADEEEVNQVVELETTWLDRIAERTRAGIAEVERETARERERQVEHNRLAGMREAFQQQLDGHRDRIRVRELADELLQGAMDHLAHRFNHNLRGLVGKTLPMFTEGRYEHLQIDEGLTVRAFSSEKRDFMDLDEISSGTQRQIMLALRLALSQELINRVVKGAQFLFLDEPFAFFDDSRTRSALEVLPRLSEELTQIWIVAQQFPEEVAFDRRIQCARENEGLTIG